MAYGYKHVNETELDNIVSRLYSARTRASVSWRHDYNAQDEHLKQCRIRDPGKYIKFFNL